MRRSDLLEQAKKRASQWIQNLHRKISFRFMHLIEISKSSFPSASLSMRILVSEQGWPRPAWNWSNRLGMKPIWEKHSDLLSIYSKSTKTKSPRRRLPTQRLSSFWNLQDRGFPHRNTRSSAMAQSLPSAYREFGIEPGLADNAHATLIAKDPMRCRVRRRRTT